MSEVSAASIIEELLDVFQLQEDSKSEEGDAESSEEELVLSECAAAGTMGRKTIKFHGLIQKQQLLILVDSGSSSNFLAEHVVTKLGLQCQQVEGTQVTIADGGKLLCNRIVPAVEWWCQGQTFVTDFKVLTLSGYDMILGMEWLETISPMWVDWRRKKLRFTYHNQRLTFIGVKDQINFGKLIIAKQMQGLYKDGAIAQIVQLCQAEVPAHAGQTYPAEIDQVIAEFKERFDEPQGLPPHRQFDHNIPLLPNAKPVTKKPYRYSPQQKNEIEKQVTQMLQQGIIQSNVSPFASPVLLVKKKDGTWRFCVDYRGLNEITVKNKYPMPVVEELLDELADAQWFTKLDLRSGYHQIRLVEQDETKTAFRTHQGHYEFKVMPFGLTNAPATFQGLMNTIFSAVIRKFVLVFVDDILIYSKSLEEHVDHLRTVFQLLQQHGLFVKASKCSFAQQHLDYLGHVIGIHGVSTDPKKVMAVQHWPIPKNLKQLRGFLGLAGYYRKFIKGYGILTKPLTELLKKDVKYKWEQQEQTAFDAVKMALTQSPVLALPDFSKQFVVETDASDKGIGAVLMQQGHPIAFISKALGVKSQMLSTYEKEFMAILLAVNKWRSYLQHAEFVIQTDHKSLTHLNEQQLGTSMQQKAFVKLMGLQYVIKYKKGAENQVADALSRRGEEECVAITVSTLRWMELVVEEYHNHPQTKQLLASLCLNPEGEDGFQLVNGVIRFHGKIWLGHHPEAQQSVLLALHNSGVGDIQALLLHITELRVCLPGLG